MREKENTEAVRRLTALWALSESGLGGLMFALKIPLTGIFVGGFAVLLISLIAWHSNGSPRTLLRALVTVLLIKATVSPHAPLPAYLAVAFQGCMGMLLFRIAGFRVAALLLGILAMLESAFQKIIVMTLIFGNALWDSVDKLWAGIVKDFSLPAQQSGTWYVLSIYGGIYFLWGLLIGWWAGSLPRRAEQAAAELLPSFRRERTADDLAPPNLRRRRKRRWLLPLVILALLVFTLLAGGNIHQAWYLLLRSMAVTALLYYVVGPLLRRAIVRIAGKASATRQQELQTVMGYMPAIRKEIKPAWRYARQHYSGADRYQTFVLLLVALALSPAHAEQ